MFGIDITILPGDITILPGTVLCIPLRFHSKSLLYRRGLLIYRRGLLIAMNFSLQNGWAVLFQLLALGAAIATIIICVMGMAKNINQLDDGTYDV